MTGTFQDLQARELFHQVSSDEVEQLLNSRQVTLYAGFDPTASSLHLGNMVPGMALAHLQKHGHRVIALVGGATGMIGDPSGKSEERKLLTPEVIAENVRGIERQLRHYLCFDGDNPAIIVNNYVWISKFSYIDWLREVGKSFTVNYMMAKDSVKTRLEDRDQGISYTEFSYMLLQAYDFLHLYREYGCELQIGGSDQWGNITAGIELTRRTLGKPVYGLTFPLMTTSSGAKFGKSEGNAVWLDAERTSPWDFYQYWVRAEDADVGRYLKTFTFLPVDEINALLAEHAENPGARAAQKRLAHEATTLLHGPDVAESVAKGARFLYGEAIDSIDEKTLFAVLQDAPQYRATGEALQAGIPITDILADSGLIKSKGEARRLIKSGGISLNNAKVTDEKATLTGEGLLTERLAVLRSGKKNYLLIIIE